MATLLVIDPAFMSVKCGNLGVTTRLIDYKYITLSPHIPTHPEMKATVDVAALRESVDRLLNLAVDVERTISMTFKDSTIDLATRDKLVQQGEDTIDADITGPECERKVDARKFRKAIAGTGKKLQIGICTTGELTDRLVLLDEAEPDWRGMILAIRI